MTSLRKQLIARVAKLGVEERASTGRDDDFASLCYLGKPFAHFHDDNKLDIHLARAIIALEGLVDSPNSVVHPKRPKATHSNRVTMGVTPLRPSRMESDSTQ
jgi:hypothetical protein